MARTETNITDAVNAVNTIVSNQATMIGRIQRALNGKAGQSSGVAGGTFEYQSIPNAIRDYLNEVTYDPSDTTTSVIENYLNLYEGGCQDKPLGKSISTDAGTLEIYYTGGSRTEVTGGGSFEVFDIAPDHGSVLNYVDGDITRAYTLCPTNALRMINTPTAHNVRDLGGWACDGGHVAYGLIYRGALPYEADTAVMKDYLGITHQMDLRGESEAEEDGNNYSAIGVRYHIYPHYAFYRLVNSDADAESPYVTETLTAWLTDVFTAVKYNEPVYFHCASGADRTGTLAFILLGLLGVSRSDMDKEYEITSFFSNFQARPKDRAPRKRNSVAQWQRLVTQLNTFSGTTTRDKLVTLVKSLGFTADDINEFRRKMIVGNPEVIV